MCTAGNSASPPPAKGFAGHRRALPVPQPWPSFAHRCSPFTAGDRGIGVGPSSFLRTEADDERTREVGQIHSIGEVLEPSQTDGGGGDGGKGSGQGEPAPAKRVPDTEPGRRAERTGARTRKGRRGLALISVATQGKSRMR